ncbi:MAG: VWA domain-containing protein, partial [Myxococcales bacterium]|nr:VWA domain-containing protein [Myxococcales bacterium]
MRPNAPLTLCLILGALGCSDGGGGSASGGGGDFPAADPAPPTTNAGPGATGVGQIGAQDFGLFRQILDDGNIPAPGTLDAVGFFAEHKLDYPQPECGEDICVHALLGVQGNMVNGGDCTVIQIGMNSPLRPDAADRPPLDLVLALDVSGSMRGAPIEALRVGLHRMLDHLGPDDTVTLVPYATEAFVALEPTGLDERARLEAAIDALATRGNTNIYDGLFLAFEQAEQRRAPDREARVVLLSDGVATTGLVEPARLRRLAEAYARRGIGVTTIGVGRDFDVDVMRGIAEVGAGNFYFLESPAAVEEVFVDEVQTFLVPVALDATLELRLGPHYVVRGAYGTHAWRGGRHGGKAELPALFLA